MNHIQDRAFKLMIIVILSILAYAYGVEYGENHNSTAEINMPRIKRIESSNNPKAHNKRSGARGLYQITNIARVDFNRMTGSDYSTLDLFDPDINKEIAKWQMNKRIPQLHRHFNIPDTTKNRLISYNAGILRTKNHHFKGARLPLETKKYIRKYKGNVWSKLATFLNVIKNTKRS